MTENNPHDSVVGAPWAFGLTSDLCGNIEIVAIGVRSRAVRRIHGSRLRCLRDQADFVIATVRGASSGLVMDSTGPSAALYDELRRCGLDVLDYNCTEDSTRALMDNLVFMIARSNLILPLNPVCTPQPRGPDRWIASVPGDGCDCLASRYGRAPFCFGCRMSRTVDCQNYVVALALAAWGLPEARNKRRPECFVP